MTPAVRVARASIGYDGRPVVSGIDFEAPPGRSVALVGTNGSGKTTLLRTLAGLLAPCSGLVEVLGGRPRAAPARVGYLSQFHTNSLLLPIRVADVVRMGRFAGKGLLGRLGPGDRAAVIEGMELMGVAELGGEPLRDLSGGQQQRVFIAQVLARQAELLLLDEPAAGVDAASRQLLATALDLELARGATVVTATHDIADAMRADLVLLLARRVVAVGPPDAVLTPAHLLDTFGLALQEIGGRVMVMDPGHGHSPHDHAPQG